MSVMPETWANIRCGTRKSREMSPPAKRNVAMEAKPIVTAVVTPINISTNTAEKMRNIVMSEARSSEFPEKNRPRQRSNRRSRGDAKIISLA